MGLVVTEFAKSCVTEDVFDIVGFFDVFWGICDTCDTFFESIYIYTLYLIFLESRIVVTHVSQLGVCG